MPYSPGEGGELVSASVRSYFLIVLTYFFSSPLGYNKGSEDVAKGSGVRETDRPGLKSQHCRHCWMPGPYYLGLSFLISKVDIKTYLGGGAVITILTITITDHLGGRGASYLFKPRYPKIPRRRMLTKLPKDARKMDKSDDSETWTSGSRRAWAGGEPPPASH